MRGELQQRKRTKAKEKSRGWESNPQPTVYKTVALPVELPRHYNINDIKFHAFLTNNSLLS